MCLFCNKMLHLYHLRFSIVFSLKKAIYLFYYLIFQMKKENSLLLTKDMLLKKIKNIFQLKHAMILHSIPPKPVTNYCGVLSNL